MRGGGPARARGGCRREAPRRAFAYHARRMIRISWPLAIVAAGAIAVVARRPRLLFYVLAAFAVWFAVETLRNRRRR